MNEVKTIKEIGATKTIAFEHLFPSKFNEYEISGIDELEASIESCGLLTPLSVVGPTEEGNYHIISGERRYTAIKNIREKDPEKFQDIACYVVGTADTTENEQKLLIHIANLITRSSEGGISKLQAKRFEMIKLIKKLSEEDPEKYGNPTQAIQNMMKVSPRYARMYNQVFENAIPELKKIAENGDLKMTDASKLSYVAKEEQKKAVEELVQNKMMEAQEAEASETNEEKKRVKAKARQKQEEIIDKYTEINKRRSNPYKKSSEKKEYDIKDLEAGVYEEFLDDDGYDDVDLNLDSTGYIQGELNRQKNSAKENYQDRLIKAKDVLEQLLKKREFEFDEEYELLSVCEKVVNKFV